MKYCYWKEFKPGFWNLFDSEDHDLVGTIDTGFAVKGHVSFYKFYQNSSSFSFTSMTVERAKEIIKNRLNEFGYTVIDDDRLKNFL